MVGALSFLPILLIGFTSAQCPTPCSMYKVFNVGEMCGPPGEQFHCGGRWRLLSPFPHPGCTTTIGGSLVNVCRYRRQEDNKEYCFCDPGNSIYDPSPVSGESCARDCIGTTKKTCVFWFILEHLFSDTSGRLADGLDRSVLVYNGKLPGPTITVCEGDDVVVNLINNLSGNLGPPEDDDPKLPLDSTTLHFHGIREKQKSSSSVSEGGPIPACPSPTPTGYISDSCIFTYKFSGSDTDYNNAPAGTYWYHSHNGRQRMNGAAGKLIIMPRQNRPDNLIIDVDDPKNSLFLQEWYPTLNNEIPTSLLVNGKGKQSKEIYKCVETPPETYKQCIGKYKGGDPVTFKIVNNPHYPSTTQTNYEVFHVKPGNKNYRFRIIGGIGDNVPIRISIEDHTFTAIATDSIDIKPYPDLDALWITAGERYDIVINTKPENYPFPNEAYKINVFHSWTAPTTTTTLVLCSLAWLKYPEQTVDRGYEANCNKMQSAFSIVSNPKVLNPVPNDGEWDKPNYVYPNDLSALETAPGVGSSFNEQYISMPGYNFNNFTMNYPNVPFLFQSPQKDTYRCGVKCTITGSCDRPYPIGCVPSLIPTTEISKEHVIQQPWSSTGNKWFEIILINGNGIDVGGIAHPIHHHGGWFNIVGMGQFDSPKTRDQVIAMDQVGSSTRLSRNTTRPVYKDTIQVPTNGYVIFRAPLDNSGVWLVHCHINYHNEHGMAMVIQIGKPGDWSKGPYDRIC